VSGDGLFDGIFERGAAARAAGADAWLGAMLETEAALAAACADAGVTPRAVADEIATACRAGGLAADELARAAADHASPVVPLVAALRARVSPAAAPHVHRGATSQDVVDTAASLVARRVLELADADLARAADRCARLAHQHRATVMLGRTLLQPALPITFGLKAAGWLQGLLAARGDLVAAHERLAIQLGGAAGTLASLGERGPAVAAALATRLALAEPALPWHAERTRIGSLAGALGTAAGAAATVALDVVLLAQGDLGEVREEGEGRGGSSAMPQKRNPVAAVSALACARRVPALVATVLAAMAQELERGAGTWQAEPETLRELLRLTGSTLAWTAESLERLVPDTVRMRANLDAAGDGVLAEAAVAQLEAALGDGARAAVEAAVRRAREEGGSLAAALARDGHAVDLDPGRYLGSAALFVDRALDAHRRSG
jgi:3-carboxy-cis,cis-muconate cycloisomerase